MFLLSAGFEDEDDDEYENEGPAEAARTSFWKPTAGPLARP
jgi:hypothetical protein